LTQFIPQARPPNDASHRPAIWAFCLGSLVAIIVGAAVMARSDIPLDLWIRNPIAWVVAASIGAFTASRGWVGFPVTLLAILVLFLTMWGPGQEGVFRWVSAGPVQLNAAALVLPLVIAVFTPTRKWLAIPCFLIIGAVIARQPDISQLAGLVIAGLILFCSVFGVMGALGALILGGALIGYCLMQPDPLLPVPHVEGIFGLALDQSQVLGIGLPVALGVAALSPLLVWGSPDLRWKGVALAGYFSITALAPLFGAYPVPLGGYGLSFVVGWVLGFAALATRRTVNSLTSA
jgi:hypothetical protein